jgi:hypothetical protein
MPSDGKSSPCLWQGELKKTIQGISQPGLIIFVPGYIACIVDNYCLRICLFGSNLKFNMATRTIIFISLKEIRLSK